jgi:rsbT co-antagonist protein RsbR
MKMALQLHNITHVAHPDEDLQRRGRNVIIISLALIMTASVFLVIDLMGRGSAFWFTIIPLFIYFGMIALARRAHVTLAALILIGMMTAANVGVHFVAKQISLGLFYFALPILVANLALRPWQIAAVWLAMLGAITGLVLTFPIGTATTSFAQQIVIAAYMINSLIALTGILNAGTAQVVLQKTLQAKQEAEVANAALTHANTNLDQIVHERTQALQVALTEVESRSAAQTRLLAELEQQREVIRETSVPVLPISHSTLVMPLIGALDTERLRQVQERALKSIEQLRASHLLLDITGVPIVDSQVAQGLIGVVQAARLLGTEVALVGIRPEVAQAVVGLGLDLSAISTHSSLQSGLSETAKKT